MISGFLLFLLVVWLGYDALQDLLEQRREAARRTEILALRQRYVGLRQDDPTANEMFGDALRQAGHTEAARDAYLKAQTLFAGAAAGQHLVNKLRLVALELAENYNPGQFGQTLATRDAPCRRCGTLNLPNRESCDHCGAPLLVSGFLETVTKGSKMRGEILAILWPLVAKTAVFLLAIGLATALPLEIRGAVMIATIIVVPFVALKQVGDPTLD